MNFDHMKSLDVSNRTARCQLSFQTKQAEAGDYHQHELAEK